MRALSCLLAFALVGCANIQTETRTDRGPTLRIYDREASPSPGGVRAQLKPSWPKLDVSVSTFDLCRHEKVEEYVEERITEKTAPTAGPAIAMGVTDTVLGTGLYLGSFLMSDAPNTRAIDASGHYGPSDRQIAQGWSIGLLVLGVPALITGAIGLSQTGELNETRKAEQVISAMDMPCHEQPAKGALELVTARPMPPVPLDNGKATLTSEQLAAQPVALLFDGREVEMSLEDADLLGAFEACASPLVPPGPFAFRALSDAQLTERLERARRCRTVPGGPGAQAVAALEQVLVARGPEAKPAPAPERPIHSFEEAVLALAPALRFSAESADLSLLADPDALAGQAVRVEGILSERIEENILGVDIGPQRVLLYVEGEPPWMADLSVGSRVEGVAIVVGRHTLGRLDAPLLRAAWLRRAL